MTRPPIQFSIVIPLYNNEHYIEDAVRSVLAQDYPQLDVIVVDDGSTDRGNVLVQDIRDTRLRYFHQKNAGESSARNKGIRQATGDYVIFLDSDDRLAPGILVALAAVMAAKPQRDPVFYGARASFTDGDDICPERESGAADMFGRIVRGITLTPGQFAVRRDVLEAVGSFREGMPFGEDWEFLLRLARSHPFTFVDRMFVHKRRHRAMQSLRPDRPDLYQLRVSILKKTFPDEWPSIRRKYLQPWIIADWHRSFAFSYAATDPRKAARYLAKSLRTWPLQLTPWLWLLNRRWQRASTGEVIP